MSELHYLTICELSRLIRDKRLSSVELTEALLKRALQYNGQINSYITIAAETALAQAKQAEADIIKGNYRGPMHGIPYGLKDIIATEGILTTGNSRTQQSYIPSKDATVVAKLKEAGAILLGKQTAHEFAHGGPSFDLPWPPARNPWNTDHFTGSSSSGSSAGLAAGFVPAALGTDTGGSIRSPASYCGVVGLKPTYGRVSRHGVMPHSFSLDHCGPMARTAKDCALILQAIAGYDSEDPASAQMPVPDFSADLDKGVKGLRVGVLRHLWQEDHRVGAELSKATDEVIDTLRCMGAIVEDARVRPSQIYSDVKAVICESEAFAIQRPQLRSRLSEFGHDYRSQILLALLLQGSDYVRAQRHRRVLAAEIKPLYEKYDVLLTAGLGPAPRLDVQAAKPAFERWGQPSMTTIFNITGAPALMLCSGFSQEGLPIGVQVAGRPFDEQTVLRVGHFLQQHTEWHKRHPELKAQEPRRSPVVESRKKVEVKSDAATVARVRAMAEAAGLSLSVEQLEELASAIPLIKGTVDRIPDHSWTEEPAGIFNPLF